MCNKLAKNRNLMILNVQVDREMGSVMHCWLANSLAVFGEIKSTFTLWLETHSDICPQINKHKSMWGYVQRCSSQYCCKCTSQILRQPLQKLKIYFQRLPIIIKYEALTWSQGLQLPLTSQLHLATYPSPCPVTMAIFFYLEPPQPQDVCPCHSLDL